MYVRKDLTLGACMKIPRSWQEVGLTYWYYGDQIRYSSRTHAFCVVTAFRQNTSFRVGGYVTEDKVGPNERGGFNKKP